MTTYNTIFMGAVIGICIAVFTAIHTNRIKGRPEEYVSKETQAQAVVDRNIEPLDILVCSNLDN